MFTMYANSWDTASDVHFCHKHFIQDISLSVHPVTFPKRILDRPTE